MSINLKEAREKAGYTIEEVSEILKIRKQYIIGLEEDIAEDLPAQVYVDGYKKLYYKFLGLKLKNQDSVHIKKTKPSTKKKFNEMSILLISTFILAIVIFSYIVLKTLYKNDKIGESVETNESIDIKQNINGIFFNLPTENNLTKDSIISHDDNKTGNN